MIYTETYSVYITMYIYTQAHSVYNIHREDEVDDDDRVVEKLRELNIYIYRRGRARRSLREREREEGREKEKDK